jgi:hypothetical protein
MTLGLPLAFNLSFQPVASGDSSVCSKGKAAFDEIVRSFNSKDESQGKAVRGAFNHGVASGGRWNYFVSFNLCII